MLKNALPLPNGKSYVPLAVHNMPDVEQARPVIQPEIPVRVIINGFCP